MNYERLDIVQVIKDNPLSNLSRQYETKLIQKVRNTFSNNEEKLFLSSFYCYLNYDSKKDFVISLDDVWKWCGFSRKDHYKRLLEKHFTKDTDYKILLPRIEEQVHGGHNKETVLMNVETFKGLCMIAGTSKSKEIRKYYLKLEELMHETLNEETEELKSQIEKKNKALLEKETELHLTTKKLKLLEKKPDTFGFLTRKNGMVYMISDNAKPGHYKIGMTTNIQRRLTNLNTSSSEKSLNLKYEIESYDCELFERTIQNILQPFNICGRREWFYFTDEIELNYAISVMNKTKHFLDNFNLTSYKQFLEKFKKECDEECDEECNKECDEECNKECYEECNKECYEEYHEECDEECNEECNKECNKECDEEYNKECDEEFTEKIKETNPYKLARQLGPNNTGKYKGICWSKEKKKWKAELKKEYIKIFLGYHENEEDAAKAYNDYALFVNQTENKNYILNDISNYISIPRDIPNLNKELINEKKTSKYIGVSYDSKRKYYVVAIKFEKKTYNLGNNKKEEECAKIYNQQALYFNNHYNTKYKLNNISNYETIEKDFRIKETLNKSSKYFGVTFNKKRNNFRSCLVLNKKQIHLGVYTNELDAAKAYNKKAIELNEAFNKKYKINKI